jgi:hypothetical protein
MLIDCGTLGNKTTALDMPALAKRIAADTNGKLDLLVATHEHKDHLSGFGQDALEKLPADRVWLAWTEDPTDAVAKSLAKTREDLGRTLAAASAQLAQSGGAAREVAVAMRGLLDFAGEPAVLGAKFAKTIHALMESVRARPGVQYLKPGERAREEAWCPGFRFYVLGPPRDEKAIGDTGEHGSGELYGLMASMRAALAFRSAGQSFSQYGLGGTREAALFDQQMPFDPRFRLERGSATVRETFKDTYYGRGGSWRSIDDDWMSVLSELALQLDSATNNTSLVLAIERVADGKVLLFPADAQQGNWLSWHGPRMKWEVKDAGGQTRTVTAADLLSRTVFYKVGHHGSHNATARGKGLEMMQARDLVAFIPVDREKALAQSPRGSWRMPARPLYRRLLEKCDGRVVRSDLGWADDWQAKGKRTIEKEFDGLATPAEWKDWKKAQRDAEAAGVVQVTAEAVEFVLR